MKPLSLKAALAENRLDDFIAQEEARGVGPVDLSEFEKLAEALAIAPRPEDQTSHSHDHDD